jgi:branched-chain amino acid transport system ATP-binding protein
MAALASGAVAEVSDSPGAPAGPALQLNDVHAGYDQVEVLHGVTLSVAKASVVALLGPNGAGKSTTLRTIAGVVRPTSGTVVIEGTDVSSRSADSLARSGLCSVPEGRAVFPNLTVAENLRMWTFRDRGLRRSEIEEEAFTRFPQLAARRKQMAGTLSGGEQQMLAMSRALSTNPRLLLLDEISMGLAPIVVGQLYELVAGIAAEGFTILLVEQFAQTALAVADRAAVMIRGGIVMEDTPAEVGAAVAELYLHAKRQ